MIVVIGQMFDQLKVVEWFRSDAVLPNLIASIIVILTVFASRAFAQRWMRSREWLTEELRLGWRVRVNNIAVLVVLLTLIGIWSAQLQTLALSAIAIAAALVVATKELLLCISGSFLRTISRAFGVGDRIEVSGLRGEVINLGFLTTTILEIGPGNQRSGRAIVIPNSVFMSQSVVNETYTEDYVLHLFTIPVVVDQDWMMREELLLECAYEVCEPHIEAAREHMNKLAIKHNLLVAQTEPRVMIHMKEADKALFAIRVPTPAREKNYLEQLIVRRYLTALVTRTSGKDEVVTDVAAEEQVDS